MKKSEEFLLHFAWNATYIDTCTCVSVRRILELLFKNFNIERFWKSILKLLFKNFNIERFWKSILELLFKNFNIERLT